MNKKAVNAYTRAQTVALCQSANIILMVSEGKEQAIEHLSKADLAFIAVLINVEGGLAKGHDKPRNSYGLKFENIKIVRGHTNRTADGTHFEYSQSPKGLKFKIENESDEQIKQAAEDDEVKEPKEGNTYVAILKNENNIEILVEINPHDISEIIQSARDKETTT
ncbi:unnamed protein product [Rotaria sordida]|uniref:Uncharacterized protein n=2 Tax=Rotaria sordida TaxID=392033 RepID=A0A815B373_9BILA|nr:unnamed protein product [Rotaria sordida]CAF1262381.1 unnamed protein product [Rotaria sordida]